MCHLKKFLFYYILAVMNNQLIWIFLIVLLFIFIGYRVFRRENYQIAKDSKSTDKFDRLKEDLSKL
jgi:hypothetical protein